MPFDRTAITFANRLLVNLDQHWNNDPAHRGIWRPSYSVQEEDAAKFIIAQAKSLGLGTFQDNAGNYYMILPGTNPNLPAIVTGSHLDSVPAGGRYDGPAGVVGPLGILAGFIKDGVVPRQTICVMIIRGEESAWYGQVSIGSKLAVGALPPEKLRVLTRQDNGSTLANDMRALGIRADALQGGKALFPTAQTACFVELHIEQGPYLNRIAVPVGIVTGIRGNIRYKQITCQGEAGHTGTVPHEMRRDAVRAAARLITSLEDSFEDMQRGGKDVVFTFPIANTWPGASATTIPKEFTLGMEVRSQSQAVLDQVPILLREAMDSVAKRYGVSFTLANPTVSAPALMDEQVQNALADSAQPYVDDIPVRLPSGAGHDAAVFANAGIPCGMLFVRHNGISHHPDEDIDDEAFHSSLGALGEFFRRGFLTNAASEGMAFAEALMLAGATPV